MTHPENAEKSTERLQVENKIARKLKTSERIGQFMAAVTVAAGVFMAAETDQDLSLAVLPVEEQGDFEDKAFDFRKIYIPFALITGAGVISWVEKFKAKRRIDNLINDYAGTKYAGYSKTTLVIDEQSELAEVKDLQAETIHKDLSLIGDSGMEFVRKIGMGVSTFTTLELYETLVTNESYHNLTVNRLMLGTLAGAFVWPMTLKLEQASRGELAMERLDNIDNGLGFDS